MKGRHPMTLTGKRVVVLGGTSGIGLATADLAAQLGAAVTVASSNPETVKRALKTLPPATTGEVVDLTDNTDVAGLFDRIGPFDHLVFTAGETLTMLELRAMNLDRARKAFELRYFGMLGAVSAAIPHLRPGGSIVLTSGTAGDRPGAGWSVAASLCGAIESVVRAMAVELAPLRVNAVKPGVIRSPLWSNLDEQTRTALYDETAGSIPLGRVGETEDVAKAYVYLMNQDFATGTIVTVDGGTVLA
jgi:NAD(P)-dependent dehydrogenase (short-subunit alcohol dehydrogenase family)